MNILVVSVSAIVNQAMVVGVQMSVQVPAFSSFGCIQRGGLAGPCGNPLFHFLRKHYFTFPLFIDFESILEYGAR